MNKKKHYPQILVFVYSLIGMTIPAAVSQFSMSVAEIANAMEITNQMVLAADTIRAACLVIAMYASNHAYKKLGLKKAIMLGLSLQITSQLFLPLAIHMKSIALLFLLKGMQGCNAVAFPLYISLILMWVDDSKSGISTAIFNGSFTAGGGIGAWVAAKIIPQFGWELSFYIIGGICLILAVPAILLTSEKKEESGIEKQSLIQKEKMTNKQEQYTLSKKNSYREIIWIPSTWVLVIASLGGAWVSQAIAVDLPIYSAYLKYDYDQSGRLMFILSIITVATSLLAGLASDAACTHSKNKLKARCSVLAMGYVVAAIFAVFLSTLSFENYGTYVIVVSMLMLGTSWALGALWPVMNLIYTKENAIAGISFCSSTATICNLVAPFVTGVLLGAKGYWFSAWIILVVISSISCAACIALYKIPKVSAVK